MVSTRIRRKSRIELEDYDDEEEEEEVEEEEEEDTSDSSVSSAPKRKAARKSKTPTKPKPKPAAKTTPAKPAKSPKQPKKAEAKSASSKAGCPSLTASRYPKARDRWLESPSFQYALQAYEVLATNSPVTEFLVDSPAVKTVPLEDWLTERALPALPRPVLLAYREEAADQELSLPSYALSGNVEDSVMNCAGPVSSIAFAPWPTHQPPVRENLCWVVGLNRLGWPTETNDFEMSANPYAGSLGPRFQGCTTTGRSGWGADLLRNTGITENHDNLLQVWSHSGLSYCVELLGRGSVRMMAWHPSSASASALGLLAVATGQGKCLLFLLPRTLSTTAKSNTVIRESSLCVAVVEEEGSATVTCCSWSSQSPYDLVVGLSNGTVNIFNVMNEKEIKVVPLVSFSDFTAVPNMPSLFSITSAQLCPYNPDLLLTSSVDGYTKIWSRQDPHQLLYSQRHGSAQWWAIWDPQAAGFYHTDSDPPIVLWNRLWAGDCSASSRNQLYQHSTSIGMVTGLATCVVDGITVIHSSASDGTVRGGIVASLATSKSPPDGLLQCLSVHSLQPAAVEEPILGKLVLSRQAIVPNPAQAAEFSLDDKQRHALAATAVACIALTPSTTAPVLPYSPTSLNVRQVVAANPKPQKKLGRPRKNPLPEPVQEEVGEQEQKEEMVEESNVKEAAEKSSDLSAGHYVACGLACGIVRLQWIPLELFFQ
eukprot:gene2253-2467_t